MAITFEELVSKVIERTDPAPAPDIDKFASLVSDSLLSLCCTCPGVYAEVWNSIRDHIQSGELFGVTFAAAVPILKQIETSVGNYTDAEPIELAKTVRLFADKLLTTFLAKLDGAGTATLPEVLVAGPKGALNALKGLFDLLTQMGRMPEIDARLALVQQSLKQLLSPGSVGPPFSSDQFLGAFLNRLLSLPADVRAGGDPAALVDGILRSGLVFPKGSILAALDSARDQHLWAWTTLPASLTPGQLAKWLNDPTTYLNGPGTGRLHILERQFRLRLIAAVDAYFLDRTGSVRVPSALTHADERDGTAVAADLVCLFFDTVMHFILEPDCYPATDSEWDSIEDVGFQYAGLAARQLRGPIRAAVGLLIRGTGFWPIRNDVLVESIGAVLGSAFSAIQEGVIRNLAWTLQVVSRYQRDAPVGGPFVHRWESLETVANTTAPADRLVYVAVVRSPSAAPGPALNLSPFLKQILEDLGAYLDVCFNRFLLERRFPTVAPSDIVAFPTPPELLGDRLVVQATTTEEPPVPRPVLRAYFCCHVAIMQPDPAIDGLYELDIKLPTVPRNCFEVTVLSNRGGRLTAKINRP